VSGRTLILAGPTASGKTAAALAIAAKWPAEIVSVDSALIYRGMDIGTAKPSVAERAAVPHHLIDIRDPAQRYSAAEFVRDADAAIADIHARGRLAILTGGTMLYVKAWLEGLDDMPAADAAVRDVLTETAKSEGWPAMHARLMAVDPATANRLAPNDSQRIQRALEVYESSGIPLSQWQTKVNRAAQPQRHTAPLISLEPNDRAWLHARINQRFVDMLDAGFETELMTLRARTDLTLDLPSVRCVGYRQAWELLDTHGALTGDTRYLWVERGSAATRQLAKRQLTWLRSMPTRRIVPADAPDALWQLMAVVESLL
jgi:tRNA dimethylallyltransferase